MNYPVLFYYLGNILCIESLFMIPAMLIALYCGEWAAAMGLLTAGLLCAGIGVTGRISQRKCKQRFYAREGFVIVALAWVVVSILGSLPFFISGAIPNYIDALFETVSGFTTTGSTILTDVEALPRSLLYWRSFTHWLGGMGVLVFVLAVIPATRGQGQGIHLLRAESTGPEVGKLVPGTSKTAKILYLIYCAMTLVMLALLLVGGMPLFDAVCTALGTAGTGGFGVLGDSIASYGVFCQSVITVFMLLFGVNFSIYYLIIMRQISKAIFNEELRVYLLVFAGAVVSIAANLIVQLGSTIFSAVHHAAFQVSSIMSSTGFATMDFNLWPQFSKAVLLCLMIFGACAGSTGGGIKIARAMILFKSAREGLRQIVSPRSVRVVKFGGSPLDPATVRGVNIFMVFYLMIMIVSVMLVSFDNMPFETNFTAVLTCINNIGPGLGEVGPAGSFYGYSAGSKLVLIANMFVGRLEIFPMLILLRPATWKRASGSLAK